MTDLIGAGLGIEGELGWGPMGADPTNDWEQWTWVPAAYVGDEGNNDRYAAQALAEDAGMYDYTYRFRLDGSDWLYCDLIESGGSNNGYDDPGLLVCACSKWLQAPDCAYGVDMPSYGRALEQGMETQTWFRVADDWICDGRPIRQIRWWGSYPGYWVEHSPHIPPVSADHGRPLGFRLTWYTDIPADLSTKGYSMPGNVLTNIYAPLTNFNVVAEPGTVSEQYECTVENKETPPTFEDEFEYNLVLEEPWNEKDGRIYWLSVEAVFDPQYIPDDTTEGGAYIHPEWGWKTSPETNVIDDAVVWMPEGLGGPADWLELAWPAPEHYPWPGLFLPPSMTPTTYQNLFTEHPEGVPSVNMAFELLTDVCPRRTEKWAQPPDMFLGEDMWSWTDLANAHRSEFLRADDFVSDGRRISDIHWWGSYSNWMIGFPGSETNPIAPPGTNGYMRPVFFNLSWHKAKDPECIPGEEITNVWVSIDDCHEMYYGTVTQSWYEPLRYEHEYQYYVDLMDVAEPWDEEEGVHYWLNIEAVFDPRFTPSQDPGYGHAGWGWKISEILPVEGEDCSAAVSNRSVVGWISDPMVGGLKPPHERANLPYNLAFELTTDEVSTNSSTLPIVITNAVSQLSNTVHVIKSVGTSGAGQQYLQMSTNLLTNVWQDVAGQVKLAPFPPPILNTWTRSGATESNVFYRVLEK